MESPGIQKVSSGITWVDLFSLGFRNFVSPKILEQPKCGIPLVQYHQKVIKRPFFGFTGFSFKKWRAVFWLLFQVFRFKKNFSADEFSSETPPSMLLSLRLTKDFDKEEMTSR